MEVLQFNVEATLVSICRINVNFPAAGSHISTAAGRPPWRVTSSVRKLKVLTAAAGITSSLFVTKTATAEQIMTFIIGAGAFLALMLFCFRINERTRLYDHLYAGVEVLYAMFLCIATVIFNKDQMPTVGASVGVGLLALTFMGSYIYIIMSTTSVRDSPSWKLTNGSEIRKDISTSSLRMTASIATCLDWDDCLRLGPASVATCLK